jgi:hypothetical protein
MERHEKRRTDGWRGNTQKVRKTDLKARRHEVERKDGSRRQDIALKGQIERQNCRLKQGDIR